MKDQSEQSQQGYDARAVANLFLSWAREGKRRRQPFTPIEIIKLVYIAHGWCLAKLDKPLVFEQVEAWEYGPVIRSLYDAFKQFGRWPVEEDAEYEAYEGRSGPVQENIGGEYIEVLEEVYDKYSGYSGFELANLTHDDPSSPWNRAREDGSRVISGDSIKDAYTSIVQGRRAQT